MSKDNKHNPFKLNLKENNRPFIFLVCLFVAASLWFINAMEKQYENYVMIPVEFTNFPKNKTLINEPPTKLRAKIKTRGFTLLRYKINASIYPVNFNVRSFTNSKFENQESGEIIIKPDDYIYQISNQLNADINILDLYPDTVKFVFDKIVERKLRVVPNIDLEFENQYFLCDSIKFTPEYITVKGPLAIIDTLKYISTKKLKIKKLNSSIKKNFTLELIEGIVTNPDKVVGEIPVSQYTEYSEKVNVSKINVPDSLNIITFPGKVDINCIIALNQYKNINPSSFVIGVDYNDIKPGSRLIPIKIFKIPSNTKIINFQPITVEFLIERK